MAIVNTARETLSKVPLFSELSGDEMEHLTALSRTRSFRTGEVIVREGDTAASFYCVLSGQVDVLKSLGTQQVAVLASLGPGGFFGEMAVLENYVRSASVVAQTDVECLVIPGWELMGSLRSHPDMAIKMLIVLSRRLRVTDQALLD